MFDTLLVNYMWQHDTVLTVDPLIDTIVFARSAQTSEP